MFDRLSVRNKLVLFFVIGCLVPYTVGNYFIEQRTEEWLYDNNIEHTHVILKQAANQVDSTVFETMSSLMRMIVRDERVVNVSPDVTRYVDFGEPTFQKTNTESERQITELFKTAYETHDSLTFISYGTHLGGYIEYPEFMPSKPYDPRVRGWYMDAIEQSRVRISEPYQTTVSNELVISVDHNVVKDNKPIGVVSLTVSLSNIIKAVNEIEYGRTGYFLVLSPQNVFINSPQGEAWTMKTTEEVQIDAFTDLEGKNEISFSAMLGDNEKIFSVYISPISGWKFVSVIDKSEVIAQTQSLSDIFWGIFLVTFLVILIFISILSDYITKPILKISSVIDQMSAFKFDETSNADCDKYMRQKDEIGVISRAIRGMKNSFLELQDNIERMDDEIQSIDIDASTPYQVILSKDNPFSKVIASVNGLLLKMHSFKEHIRFMADHDPLTNLPNRRSFVELMVKTMSQQFEGAVLMLDLDNFKSINDTLGHLFGDKVLRNVANRLVVLSNNEAFVSRFGGDEFLLIYPFTQGADALSVFVDDLYDHFEKPFTIDETDVRIEFSLGISRYPMDSRDIEQLIMNADLALYQVKNSGKNGFAFFDQSMASHLRFKLETKTILHDALLNNGFKMVYQPVVSLKDGSIQSYEALIRLTNHAMSPATFIPVAEENGLIIPVGRIALKMVIEDMKSWSQAGLDLKPVSINFSAMQMQDGGFRSVLFECLEKNNIPPELIIIEITEHVIVENREETVGFLNDLRLKGIKIAVDDFGTGYSALNYLAYLPVDTLKFDRSLNTQFLGFENKEVMNSLINFVHSLDLKVIAEGIETREEVIKLLASGCDAVQGYYFARPMEAEDVKTSNNTVFSLE